MLAVVVFLLLLATVTSAASWRSVLTQHGRRAQAVAAIATTFSTTFVASGLLLTSATAAHAVDDSTSDALANVLRVSYSLKNVDETIEKGNDVKLVVQQISSLVKNYKLKDNLNLGLAAVSDAKREEARGHARAAVEDLSLVSEYYEDDINDMTGKKTPPKEVLTLAIQATKATRSEIDAYLSLVPSDVAGQLQAQVKEEFAYVSPPP